MGIYTDHVPSYLHLLCDRNFTVVNQDLLFLCKTPQNYVEWKA